MAKSIQSGTTTKKIMRPNSKILMRENIRAEALKEETLRDAQVMLRLRLNQEGMGTTESDYANLELAWENENGGAMEL